MICSWCHRDDDPDVPVEEDGPQLCGVCRGLVAPFGLNVDAAALYTASMCWIDLLFHYHAQEPGCRESDTCWWCGRDGERVDACVSYETEDGLALSYRAPVLCPVCDGLMLLGQSDPAQASARAREAFEALQVALAVEEGA